MVEMEAHYRIEPCLLDSYPPQVADLIADIVSVAGALGNRLHPLTAAGLADMVRVMNCYCGTEVCHRTRRPKVRDHLTPIPMLSRLDRISKIPCGGFRSMKRYGKKG